MVDAGAAPFLRNQHAKKSDLSHRPDGIAGKLRRAVPFRRKWSQPFGRKTSRHVADHCLLFGQHSTSLVHASSALAAIAKVLTNVRRFCAARLSAIAPTGSYFDFNAHAWVDQACDD